MKIIFFSMLVIGLGLSGCASHDNFYDRANSASEKSLQGLDRDTK